MQRRHLLGAGAAAYHLAVGELCAAVGVRLVAVGDLARDYLGGAPDERGFATVDEFLTGVAEAVPAGLRLVVGHLDLVDSRIDRGGDEAGLTHRHHMLAGHAHLDVVAAGGERGESGHQREDVAGF